MAFMKRDITAVDPDASKVPSVDCTGCSQLTVAFSTDTKGAQLTFSVIVTDSLGNRQGAHPPVTVVAPQAPDWGPAFVARPSEIDGCVFHVSGGFTYIKVDYIDPPTSKWTMSTGQI